jgi:hypothetical protein
LEKRENTQNSIATVKVVGYSLFLQLAHYFFFAGFFAAVFFAGAFFVAAIIYHPLLAPEAIITGVSLI